MERLLLLPGKRARGTFSICSNNKGISPNSTFYVFFSHHHTAERLVWGLAVNGGRQQVLKLVQSLSEGDDTRSGHLLVTKEGRKSFHSHKTEAAETTGKTRLALFPFVSCPNLTLFSSPSFQPSLTHGPTSRLQRHPETVPNKHQAGAAPPAWSQSAPQQRNFCTELLQKTHLLVRKQQRLWTDSAQDLLREQCFPVSCSCMKVDETRKEKKKKRNRRR